MTASQISNMAASVLGKRTRGEELPAKRTRRMTRSFREDNDENQDPTDVFNRSDAEEDEEDEEAVTFSPVVTRTPSARRTKNIYKVEAIDYRE